jgi:threonylcarbamoyladenosine tRNA methylthiotransferase MtaB
MNSFSIQSFGCRVNQAEAFSWADELQRRGLRFDKEHDRSDLILVNTCTITARADRDVRNFIRRMIRVNPEARLVVTGCLAERAAEELRRFPGVWQVVPNLEKEGLPDRILSPPSRPEAVRARPFRSRALVKIQDGCDFGCTFCVVPSVRGKSVSYPVDKILGEVRAAVERGFTEVVLAGVHLALYGRDREPALSFRGLLEDISAVEGLHRLRLSSLDPRFLENGLLDYLVSEARICPHFHLSLQHGADRIIARMGRRIGTADYERILARLHQGRPNAALGTDIIVGFPGETDKDYEDMTAFLEQAPLTYFHVFSFSPRPGTPAASWTPVPPEVKKERAAQLRTLAKEKNLAFRRGFLGRVREAVIISRAAGDGSGRALSDNYIDISLPACPLSEKELAAVEIVSVDGGGTRGRVLSNDVRPEE